MEHSPNFQPMDRKRWVGFDDFDAQIEEALADNDTAMRPLRPGQIGAVICRPTFGEATDPDPNSLPVPPQDAA